LRNALFHAQTALKPIKISTNSKGKSVVITDYGVGIAEDDIPLIFESFVTSNKKTGTGLGLAFCQRAMRMMRGSIVCQSKLGSHTRFILKF
jgi:signal transduction histidine kinase